MNSQQFPWQQRMQQGGPQQQSGAPPSFQSGQAWPNAPQQAPVIAGGYGWQQGQPAQSQQGQLPYSSPQQLPPWMMPKMPPKGNPTKKKKALWYFLVIVAIVTGLVFIGTTVYYFMTY